ncbi:MAG TPA: LuxR C-terminal-related transcriptional regulator, partial [Albitalea sp.]|nr:LuxR C-terminal-related transcriptional regulator [Albitalea sp.]
PAEVLQALQSGAAAGALQALQRWGWTLLYRPSRDALESLIAQAAALDAAAVVPYRLGMRIELDHLPHEAMRELNHAAPPPSEVLAWLQSRAEQMYDHYAAAIAHADAVLHAGLGDLHPLTLACVYSKGQALTEAGRPGEAVALLPHALRAARRDGLHLLELLCSHALARAADEAGDAALAETVLATALSRLESLAPTPTAHALKRLAAARALRRLDTDAAAPWLSGAPRGAGHWSFPYEVLLAQSELMQGQASAALTRWKALEARAAVDFICARWRADLGHLRVWCLVVSGERGELVRLAGQFTPPPAGSDASVWREALHCLAADLWSAGEAVARHAPALAEELTRQGLRRLASRARLLQGLAGDTDALAAWLDDSAGHDLIDALWLAPKAAPALTRFLQSPAGAQRSEAHALARQLSARLVAREPAAVPAPEAPLPPGLTRREWAVLQAIAQGWTNEQIASRMHVSLATVKTHVNHIYSKLQIGSRDEAKVRALQLGAS